MTLPNARHLFARARRWAGIHVLGGMPVAARIKAWRLGRQGDCAGAAIIWQRLAQAAPQARTAAIGWIQFARYCLALGRLVEAKKALEQALSTRPHDHTARVLLAEVATAQQDWREAAKYWRNALEGEPSPPEASAAVGHLIYALTSQGASTEAAAAIERYAANGTLSDTAAMQCRLNLAEKQPDEDGATVWREFYDRFPQAAVDSPDWLRFAGGIEQQSIVKYTTADLASAPDARAAQRILSFLELRLSAAEYVASLRDAAGRFPDSADLQVMYFRFLNHYLARPGDRAALQALARDFCARFPGHPQCWQLRADAAVAADDTDSLGPLVKASGRRELQIRLAARRGAWREAAALARGRFAQDGGGLDLRPLNAAPRQAMRDNILLFAHVRNEMLFLPWFLDYYRGLGVDWFFIVDNGSTDGTTQMLTAQQDVTAYASANTLVATMSGMRWINELIRRHGISNWCVYVDADEQFIAPGIESRGLRGVVDDMAARGEEVMPGFALDTYPADMSGLSDFKPGDSPLAASSLIDPDYFFFGRQQCCFFGARGGVRDRLFGIRDRIEQAPILRGGACWYLDNHHTTTARVSRECGVSLHHKILREALDFMQPRRQTALRVNDRTMTCRGRHIRYRESGLLDMGGQLPRGPNAVAYTNSDQLVRLGLIGEFATLRGGRGAAA